MDGEAIVVDQKGLSIFDLLRYRRHDHAATIRAVDLIEVDGNDLRRHPIEDRNGSAASFCASVTTASHSMAYDGDGAIIYRYACSLGCEGIVSKRLGSVYGSHRRIAEDQEPRVTGRSS
jgi:bifunctional non-homologous end joining protein LigD